MKLSHLVISLFASVVILTGCNLQNVRENENIHFFSKTLQEYFDKRPQILFCSSLDIKVIDDKAFQVDTFGRSKRIGKVLFYPSNEKGINNLALLAKFDLIIKDHDEKKTTTLFDDKLSIEQSVIPYYTLTNTGNKYYINDGFIYAYRKIDSLEIDSITSHKLGCYKYIVIDYFHLEYVMWINSGNMTTDLKKAVQLDKQNLSDAAEFLNDGDQRWLWKPINQYGAYNIIWNN